jgi:hypothetical protein
MHYSCLKAIKNIMRIIIWLREMEDAVYERLKECRIYVSIMRSTKPRMRSTPYVRRTPPALRKRALTIGNEDRELPC